jgi:hypothetical protein
MNPHCKTLLGLLFAAAIAGSCGGVIDPSQNKVEPFSGTLEPLGNRTHQFRVDKNGEIDVKITAFSNPDAIVQLAYGMGGCANPTVLNAGYRQLNQVGISGVVSPGDHCVVIQDSLGTLRQAATYTITVSHP